MGQRGRPRKNGLQPSWMLDRIIMVVQAFNEARESGIKYEIAILEAIEAVKARYPKMRIGPRRVKEILAAWQPVGSSVVFLVSKCPIAGTEDPEMQQKLEILNALGVPRGKKVTTYTVSLGTRPEYPRINSKQPKNTSKSSNSW
jgi:hypothetical protein